MMIKDIHGLEITEEKVLRIIALAIGTSKHYPEKEHPRTQSPLKESQYIRFLA